MPTKAELIATGYTEEEATELIAAGRWARLVWGCEFPGEAPTTYADLTAPIGG